MNLYILPGHMLIAPDPDEVRKGRIWFSDNMHRKATTGLVVLHNQLFLDEFMEGKHVLFEKWSWREVVLQDTLFYLVPERSIWAEVTSLAPPESGQGLSPSFHPDSVRGPAEPSEARGKTAPRNTTGE